MMMFERIHFLGRNTVENKIISDGVEVGKIMFSRACVS